MAKATPVTSTPVGYILVTLNGVSRPWRLTVGALREVQTTLGCSIFHAFGGAVDPVTAIPVILAAGFNAARRYDEAPPADPFSPDDAADLEIEDLLRVAEYIAAKLGNFFGVDIPLLKGQVAAWLNDLLAGAGAVSLPGMNWAPSEDSSAPAGTPTASGG